MIAFRDCSSLVLDAAVVPCFPSTSHRSHKPAKRRLFQQRGEGRERKRNREKKKKGEKDDKKKHWWGAKWSVWKDKMHHQWQLGENEELAEDFPSKLRSRKDRVEKLMATDATRNSKTLLHTSMCVHVLTSEWQSSRPVLVINSFLIKRIS